MKPETELPWEDNGNEIVAASDRFCGIAGAVDGEDAAYIVHACNAYPKLVEALKEVAASSYGQRHNAIALLRELGEEA